MKLFDYLNESHSRHILACRDNDFYCEQYHKMKKFEMLCITIFFCIIISLIFVLSAIVGIYCGW